MTSKEFERFLSLVVALLIALIIIGVCVNGYVAFTGIIALVGYVVYVDYDCKREIKKERRSYRYDR